MGEDVPPDLPDTDCGEDCCDDLPATLQGRLTIPGWGTLSGTLDQSLVDKCFFLGVVENDDYTCAMFVQFCDGVSDDTFLMSTTPCMLVCGGYYDVGNHCNLPAGGTNVAGCTYIAS